MGTPAGISVVSLAALSLAPGSHGSSGPARILVTSFMAATKPQRGSKALIGGRSAKHSFLGCRQTSGQTTIGQ